jgi:hypothetical protein
MHQQPEISDCIMMQMRLMCYRLGGATDRVP